MVLSFGGVLQVQGLKRFASIIVLAHSYCL
jgi:hypothetical protein